MFSDCIATSCHSVIDETNYSNLLVSDRTTTSTTTSLKSTINKNEQNES